MATIKDPRFARCASSWNRNWILITLLVFAGCGEPGPQGPPRVKTVPVTGRVVVDGGTVELPKQVIIRAHSISGESPTDTVPGANANPDGTFSMSSYETADGLPVGEYRLTFQLVQRDLMRGGFTGDDFRGKYNSPEDSEHRVTVTENDSEPIVLETIELTTK